MYIKTKFMDRHTWRRITARRDAYADLQSPPACAGLLRMDDVAAPLDVTVQRESVRIVDRGYSWMQIAPQGEHWWLTVMFDERWNLVQYYFDVTLENTVQGRESRFRDLFLDVAAIPEGQIELLDRDELDAALAEQLITPEEHRLAVVTGESLLREVPLHWRELRNFCEETCRMLRRKIDEDKSSKK